MNTETKLQNQENNRPEKLAERATVLPAVDIFENKEQLLIVADLPGVAKEDLSMNFDNGHLTLAGRPHAFGPNEEPYDYRRTFVIPQGIDAEKIAASLDNGPSRHPAEAGGAEAAADRGEGWLSKPPTKRRGSARSQGLVWPCTVRVHSGAGSQTVPET